MSKVYNIAIIGCGSMGEAHMDDIYYKENVNLLYTCDTKEDRAKNFARRYNSKNYVTDYKKVVEDKDVDIVIISTYPSSHLEILKECIKNPRMNKSLARSQDKKNQHRKINCTSIHKQCRDRHRLIRITVTT